MTLNVNDEEFYQAKLNKYISVCTTIFVIICIYSTFRFLMVTSHLLIWFLINLLTAFFCFLFIYYKSKKIPEDEPIIHLTEDALYCNFKQVPTTSEFKRKFIGTYESVKEECILNVVTRYELTDKHIIAYGYAYEDLVNLTGFVVERFFDDDEEVIIMQWLQNHISNIHDSKIQYLGNR